MPNVRTRVHEAQAVLVLDASPSVRVRELQSLVIGGVSQPFTYAHEAQVVFVGSDMNTETATRVHEAQLIVIGAEGVFPDQPLETNAFTYDIDGHVMYGLHVRGRGTFIYDLMTGQWSSPWRSGALLYWNNQFHTVWSGEYYAASLLEPVVNRIVPGLLTDDGFRTNTYRVTGRLESQERRFVPNPEMQLYGSVGLNGGPVILRYSDDDGATWSSDRVANSPPGSRSQNVMWYNLGSVRAPGRLYQIEHEGAFRRIQSLRASLIGVEDE